MDPESRGLSMVRTESGDFIYKKIVLTDKSKFSLVIRVILISLCCIFFPLEAIIDSRLEDIEMNTFINKRKVLFIGNDAFQKLVYYIILSGFPDDISVLVYLSVFPYILRCDPYNIFIYLVSVKE